MIVYEWMLGGPAPRHHVCPMRRQIVFMRSLNNLLYNPNTLKYLSQNRLELIVKSTTTLVARKKILICQSLRVPHAFTS